MKIMIPLILVVIFLAIGGCTQPQEGAVSTPAQASLPMATSPVAQTVRLTETSPAETSAPANTIAPSTTTVPEIGYTWYQNPLLGFRMKYPLAMTISNRTDVLGNTVGIKLSDPGEQSAAEVRVISGVTNNLDDWMDTLSHESTGKGYTILSMKKIQLNNTLAGEILMTHVENHQEIKILTIAMKKNDKAYLLAFGAKSEKYDEYAGLFREMIESFEFI